MGKILLCSKINRSTDAIVSLFKKPAEQLKVICITTAANVYAPDERAWLHEDMQSVTKTGIKLDEYDLSGKSEYQVKEKIRNADAVCVMGGNSYYLMEQMHRCNFKAVIVPYLESGGVYIGGSAGAVVVCPSVDFIQDMDDASKSSQKDFHGLGLINLYVMPHLDHPKYGEKARGIIAAARDPQMQFIGLKDNQAALIMGNSIELFEAHD